MRFRGFPVLLASLLVLGCDVPGDVTIQELPPLSQSSIEVRLGLPELRGPWRFAGWELQEGDTLGLEAELPALGVLMLQEQKRDSLAGLYVTGSGQAPVQGEVRRDSVVALVAFPQAGDGRYLVGSVAGDTLWVESTSLVAPEAWRGEARAVFVRSRTALTPFVRVRGRPPPTPVPDSAALAARMDSLATDSAAGVLLPPTTGARAAAPTTAPPAEAVQPGAVAQPPLTRTQPPDAGPVEAEEEEEEEAAPALEPVIERRDPPRVLGVPVQRESDDGGGELP